MIKTGSPDADIIIDRCPHCRGLWFDGGEVRAFLKSDNFKGRFLGTPAAAPSESEQPEETPEVSRRDCPRCRRGLAPLAIADVTVDVCMECLGVWLDAGELSSLVQAGKAHQLDDDDSLLAHEIREGLSSDSLSPGLLAQLVDALKGLLSRYQH
jgi:Zn-finger nucleic acid-binding protein